MTMYNTVHKCTEHHLFTLCTKYSPAVHLFLYGSLIIERQENIAKKYHYLIKEQIKQLIYILSKKFLHLASIS